MYTAGASGLDWAQATKVLEALLISPLLGFALAALLIYVSKRLFKLPSLYEAPKQSTAAVAYSRFVVADLFGVSFSHGSNDGQKGMGLIMLILIGTVPTAYALNHAVSPAEVQSFIAASEQAGHILDQHVNPAVAVDPDARAEVTKYIETKQLQPDTLLAMSQLVNELNREVAGYKTFNRFRRTTRPTFATICTWPRAALRLMSRDHKLPFTAAESAALKDYQGKLDKSIKFIPNWVKVAVALALGLGTMVGWKRIVITVGERIGRQHLSYAQGASAEVVAMATIFAANLWGLPVSTTHILCSGVAGTMTANGSGLHLVDGT